jgi:hypothetical protein
MVVWGLLEILDGESSCEWLENHVYEQDGGAKGVKWV